MPGQFLTKAEREQLSSFPPHPTEDEIITFFTLTVYVNSFRFTLNQQAEWRL